MKNATRFIALTCHVIGLLILFGLCLMGCLYIFKYTVIYSAALALLVIVVLFVLVYWVSGAKALEINKGFTLREGVGLALYVAVAVATFFAVSHYINVEFLLKQALQKQGNAKLEELTKMTNEYETQVKKTNEHMAAGMEEHILNYRTDSKYPAKDSLALYAMIDVNMDDANVMKELILEANSDFVTKGLDSLKLANETFVSEQARTLITWDRTRIHSVFKEIDDKLEVNLTHLTDLFGQSKMKKWQDYAFNFKVSARQDDLLSDTKAIQKMPGYSILLPLLACLVIHLFILLPYLLTRRRGTRRIYLGGKTNQYNGGIEI